MVEAWSSRGVSNYEVRLNENKKILGSKNEIMIKKFIRKWKKSGILREIKEKSYPVTKGMKKRKKKYNGKRRGNKNKS